MTTVAASGTEPDTGLELGIAPFLPPRILAQNYQPMRAYLEQQLGQPVIIVTAPDYKTFCGRTQRREYPVIITVANAAYLAHADAGYIPMLRPVIYTASSRGAEDNREKPADVALGPSLPDPGHYRHAAVPMLREAGQSRKMWKFTDQPQRALNHVIAGEAAARSCRSPPNAVTQAAVRVIETWDKARSRGSTLPPALSPQRVAQLTQAIQKFVRETPEGRELIKKLGYGDLVPATAQDLAPLAPYGATLKVTLAKIK
jgi:phosphonate transport system substrate-binding protein